MPRLANWLSPSPDNPDARRYPLCGAFTSYDLAIAIRRVRYGQPSPFIV
jgi:hypothetical protein